MLQSVGIIVEIVDNGLECVTAVQKEHYDIVLMDINMPIMDGFEAAREIRKDKQNMNLTIKLLCQSDNHG